MLARVDVRPMMSVSWTNERVLQLIDLYKNFECLWNTAHYDYKNKFKKREAWDTIAKLMNLHLTEVESKVHTLRSQFTRERKKFKSTNRTGSGSDDVIKIITWFAYEPLKFLLKIETSGNKDTNHMDDGIAMEPQQMKTEDEEQDSDSQQNEGSVEKPKKRLIEDKMDPSYEAIKTKKRLIDTDGTDEFEVYGKYVASELRNIKDEYSTLMAKQYINNILIDARFGKYRQEFHSYGCNSVKTRDPLTTSDLTPEIKIEESSLNSEPGS